MSRSEGWFLYRSFGSIWRIRFVKNSTGALFFMFRNFSNGREEEVVVGINVHPVVSNLEAEYGEVA